MKSIYSFLVFCLCLVANAQVTNDAPCSASPISVNTSCVPDTVDNTDATDSGVGVPTCSSYGGRDIWHYFVPSSLVTYSVSTAGVQDGVDDNGMALYTGSDCGNLSSIYCNDDFGGSLMATINFIPTNTTDTIWIRTFGYGGQRGEFTICVREVPVADNNEICDAQALPVGLSSINLE